MHLNIPNILTLLRIAMIPVIVLVFYLPYDWARPACAWIYGAAAITDWFDGYLARRWNQQSALGAFLDPVADKLFVVVALVLLVSAHPDILIVLATCIIIGREITISALREWMAELGKRSKVAVSMMGKFKTTAQMFAIAFLLHRDNWLGMPIYQIGEVLLVVAAILTLVTMFIYLRAAYEEVRNT
ncbi:MAG: CDP-diacylglycerol---glycerol-3-phosphate 3-phosphatidyltransferase [Pseudomonadota bacterium]|nr:CDP-diacylglycerol---glycerol-3-phosphate 3-phosphatidyltransferase [Pseudomonadota bacterium]